jgi:hypothetical protein
MSASEDEQQNLDAGWDDEPSSPSAPGDEEEDVDQAWDGLPPPLSGASGPASSMPPVTEAVDSGWDDLPEGPAQPGGKRRPHRQRRAKAGVGTAKVASSPVLQPRPAEPTKKQQREHARKQKAYESQVKQQRKQERKAQRVVEMRQEADARQRQAQAEALERQQRREARERAERERPPVSKPPVRKPVRTVGLKRAVAESTSSGPGPSELEPRADLGSVPVKASRGRFRPGVLVTLVVLAAVGFLLLWRK